MKQTFPMLSAAWFLAKEKPVNFFFSLLIFIALLWNFNGSYYEGKWIGFGIAFSFLLCCEVGKRYGWFASLKLMYVLGHILWFLVYPNNRYAPVKAYDLTALKLFLAESGFKLLLILAPLLVVKIDRERWKEVGTLFVCAFALLNPITIMYEAVVSGCRDVNSCGGLLSNPSLNACMAAVALPFVFKVFTPRISWSIVIANVCCALLGGTSLGLGMIAAFLVLKDIRLLILSPIILGLGLWKYGSKELLSSGDRWTMWTFFMEQWAKNKLHWSFGTGFGTFGVFSINLQNAHTMRPQYWWIWLHNDWLQCLFETGIAGFSLMLGTFLTGVRNLWKRGEKPEMQSLLLFGLAMGVNFPLHVGLSCAFGAWLILLALEKPVSHNNNESH